MMRPGAGQNYPRSGFPLEGKAAPVLYPVGKGIIIPCRDAGTKRPPRPAGAGARRTPGQPPGFPLGCRSRVCPRTGTARTTAAGSSGLAPCERPVPGAGGKDREVGSAAGPGSL